MHLFLSSSSCLSLSSPFLLPPCYITHTELLHLHRLLTGSSWLSTFHVGCTDLWRLDVPWNIRHEPLFPAGLTRSGAAVNPAPSDHLSSETGNKDCSKSSVLPSPSTLDRLSSVTLHSLQVAGERLIGRFSAERSVVCVRADAQLKESTEHNAVCCGVKSEYSVYYQCNRCSEDTHGPFLPASTVLLVATKHFRTDGAHTVLRDAISHCSGCSRKRMCPPDVTAMEKYRASHPSGGEGIKR